MARSFDAQIHDDPRRGKFAWWQVLLLISALALAGVGVAVQMTQRPATAQTTTVVAPAKSSGFLGATPAAEPVKEEPGTLAKIAPAATQLGVGFGLAFVVGTMFRTFIKTMAILAAVVIVGLFLVQWFHLATIDWSFLGRSWTRATDYVNTNAGEIRTTAATYAVSSLAGVAGFIVGFLRK